MAFSVVVKIKSCTSGSNKVVCINLDTGPSFLKPRSVQRIDQEPIDTRKTALYHLLRITKQICKDFLK